MKFPTNYIFRHKEVNPVNFMESEIETGGGYIFKKKEYKIISK